ncbi:MAG: hypothetical protein ACP5G1_03945 [Nanopusillaceae archaeon]
MVDPKTGEIIKKRESSKSVFAYDYGYVKMVEIFYTRSRSEEILKKYSTKIIKRPESYIFRIN